MEQIENIPWWALIPFVVMLLTIAVGPLLFHHWWEQNRNKLVISLALGIPTSVWLLYNNLGYDLKHQMLFDYVPFIILLGSLFVITGGIHLVGDLEAKPKTNIIFLAIGAVLASLMGTTGAAMLLIRPLIKTNSQRRYKAHTILFFIAIVANCGGLLTPLGDPPLFLLYLRGAHFDWFFHLLPEWAFVNTLLILLYWRIDTWFYKREPAECIAFDRETIQPLRLQGRRNFIFLAGVVLSVAFLNQQYFGIFFGKEFMHRMHENHLAEYLNFIRDGAILLMAVLSLALTRKSIRTDNHFTWVPITEVAYLFLGIFATMVPALLFLKFNAASFGIESTAQFYYATGSLSSFLDNAPTAVSFHNLALGITPEGATGLVAGIDPLLLVAISLGAVFFGAMTYIGNGPNFMVKAIAEENKIKMPGFFAYMFKFSLIILLPVYILTQLLFLK